MNQGAPGEARRLRDEAKRCDERAECHAEDNPMYAEGQVRRASHLRRLARDEEIFNPEGNHEPP